MSLAAQQKFQARFYTDPDLRKRSLADPMSVATEFGIDIDEVKAMMENAGPGMQVFTALWSASVTNRLPHCFPAPH